MIARGIPFGHVPRLRGDIPCMLLRGGNRNWVFSRAEHVLVWFVVFWFVVVIVRRFLALIRKNGNVHVMPGRTKGVPYVGQ